MELIKKILVFIYFFGGFGLPILLLPLIFLKKFSISKKDKIYFTISSFIPFCLAFSLVYFKKFASGYDLEDIWPLLFLLPSLIFFLKNIFKSKKVVRIFSISWLIFYFWSIGILLLMMHHCFMGACC